MKVMSKMLIRSFIGPFVATFFVVQFVLVMQFLWKYIDEMVGKGLEWNIILELIFYASATLTPMALPLAVLLSAIMTFGNLAEKYELTAVKSAGISLRRFMMPLLVVNIGIALGAFLFANYVLPKSYLKFGQLLYDVRQQKPALDLKPGVFYEEIDGFTLRVEHKDEDNIGLQGVKIWDHTSKQNHLKLITADKGKMYLSPNEHFLILELENGNTFEEMDPKNLRSKLKPFVRSTFTSQQLNFDLSAFKFDETDEQLFKNHYKMMMLSELDSVIKEEEVDIFERKSKLSSYINNFYVFGNDSIYSKLKMSDSLNSIPYLAQFNGVQKRRIRQEAKNNIQSIKGYLKMLIRESEVTQQSLQNLKIEWHKKFTLATACFLLFLIGVPLGAIIRKGGLGVPVLVAILFFLFYYILSITAEKSSKNMVLDPQFATWLATYILIPIAFFLIYKANQDSKLFDLDFYNRLIKKWFKKATVLLIGFCSLASISAYGQDSTKQVLIEEKLIALVDTALDGSFIEKYPNGKLKTKGKYERGFRIGNWEYYYENGQLDSKGKFENDWKAGEWFFYFPNGHLEEKGEFKKDLKHGVWESFYESDSLLSLVKFEYGEEHGNCLYFNENGTLSASAYYYFGLEDGVWRIYYPSGILKEEGGFFKGRRVGLWKFYKENGMLIAKCRYSFKKDKNKWRYYNEKGRVENKVWLKTENQTEKEEQEN